MASQGTEAVPKEIKPGLPKPELLKRLKAWRNYVSDLKQEKESTRYLGAFAKTIAGRAFLHHGEPEAKVLVACCLANILRVYAPEAPYDDQQLQEMFRLFVSELGQLSKKNDSLYMYRFNLLEDLAVVRCFVLCVELGSEEILLSIVKTLLRAVSGDQAKVQRYMADIILDVLREVEPVPESIVEALLEALLEKNKEENAAGYNLAVSVFSQAQNLMSLQEPLSQFFQGCLELGRSSENELAESVFDLIGVLNKVAPALLINVLPLLSNELEVEDVDRRLVVVRLLADLFGDRTRNAAAENRPLWLHFLRRLRDVSGKVRVEMLRHCKDFVHQQALLPDLTELLQERCLDPDEHVRLEAVRCITQAVISAPTAIPTSVFDAAAMRMLDKKPLVAVEAVNQVLEVYKAVLLSAASMDPADWSADTRELFKRYGWVVDRLVKAYKADDLQLRMTVETKLETHIVDGSTGEDARANQLCAFFVRLQEDSYKVIEMIIAQKCMLMKHVSNWAHLRIQAETNVDVNNEDAVLQELKILAGRMGDAKQSLERLKKLSSKSEMKIFKSLLAAADNTATEEKRAKALSEVLSRLDKEKEKGLIESLRLLFGRMGLGAFQEDVVGPLLTRAKIVHMADKHDAEFGSIVALLLLLGKFLPHYLQSESVFDQLCDLVDTKDPDAAVAGLRLMAAVGEKLWVKRPAASVQSVRQRIEKLACGAHSGQAKQAVRALLTMGPDKEGSNASLYKTLIGRLDYDREGLPATLTALCQLALLAPQSFGPHHKTIITNFVVKDLMQKTRTSRDEDTQEPLWEEPMSFEAQVRVLGIKLMVRRLVGIKKGLNDKALMGQYGPPIIKLLLAFVHDERFSAEQPRVPDASRLRLAGAKGLLRVVGAGGEYRGMGEPMCMVSLARVMQDACYEVRVQLGAYLHKLLYAMRVDQHYLALLCMAAVDPEKDCREQAKVHAERIVKNRRAQYAALKAKSPEEAIKHVYQLQPEFVLPQLMFLLAHHHNFEGTEPQLREAETIIRFFLDVLSSAQRDEENFMFMYALVEFVKETEDAETPENSDRLYMLCDLAMLLVTEKAHQVNKQWKLKSFPTQLRLPPHLFKIKEKSKRNTKSYLPQNFKLTQQGKRPSGITVAPTSPKMDKKKDKREREEGEDEGEEETEAVPKRPRKAPAKPKPKQKEPAVAERKSNRAGRTKQSMKDESGSEVEEEEEAPVVKMLKKKAAAQKTQPKKTTPKKSPAKGKAAKKKEETEEEEEEREETQEEGPSEKEETQEEETSEQEEEEVEPVKRKPSKPAAKKQQAKSPKKKPAPLPAKGRKRKAQEEEQEEEGEEEQGEESAREEDEDATPQRKAAQQKPKTSTPKKSPAKKAQASPKQPAKKAKTEESKQATTRRTAARKTAKK